MEKKVLVFSDFRAEKYFSVKEIEVDTDKYNIIVSELKRIVARHKGHKRASFSRYDYRRIKAATEGVCYRCGKSHDNYTIKVVCEKCAERTRVESQTRRNKLRSQHCCIVCGKELQTKEKESRSRCEECMKRANKLKRERWKGSKENREKCHPSQRLCSWCNKRKKLPSSSLCELCYFRGIAYRYLGTRRRWQEIEGLWKKQKGVCSYTKKVLIRGVNASIDHKYPQKRFPELADDIGNLEWIDRQVNSMKNNKTPEEFIEYLQSIIKNYQSMIRNYNCN